MANERKGFVIGYSPKLTRATGVSTTGGKDLLLTWLKKFAARWETALGKEGAVYMADRVPMKLAYMLTQHWDCSIFMCVHDELVMYSRYSKVRLPKQIIAALAANGVTQQTPVVWFKDPESDEKEQGPAANFILGLPAGNEADLATPTPHATAFESMARIIVDELTGS